MSTSPDAKLAQSQAVIPAEDLKPLYDFTLDCKACQAKLAAVQSDFTDEKTKTAALTKERDHALQIAVAATSGAAWAAPPSNSSSVPPPAPSLRKTAH